MWFGDPEEPLFGWLARPAHELIRGAVVLVPAIGFEARNSRIAYAHLSRSLAQSGFASLRFDFRGTGDSSGEFASAIPDPEWLDDIRCAVDYFRSQEVSSISLVGIRLGATMSSVALERELFQVDSLVLWDPCDSGRSYLREQSTLHAVRKDQPSEFTDGAIETIEHLIPARMAISLRSLVVAAPTKAVTRTLVLHRLGYRPPKAIRSIASDSHIDITTTDEQEKFFAYKPFGVVLPVGVMSHIVGWLSESRTTEGDKHHFILNPTVTFLSNGGVPAIRESARFLGEQEVFAVTTEPVAHPHGPLILLVSNIHDDHTGPSRIFTECARRWAQAGFRCARMDLSGIGESTQRTPRSDVEPLDRRWPNDVIMVVRALESQDPSNVVIVGMCSSSSVAYEAALACKARGICVVTPPLGRNVAHAIYTLQISRRLFARIIAKTLKSIYANHFFLATIPWEWIRRILPMTRYRDVMKIAARNGTVVKTFGSLEDLTPISTKPILRRVEGHYVAKLQYGAEDAIDALDHNMTSARGRMNLVAMLDAHIQGHYANFPQ